MTVSDTLHRMCNEQESKRSFWRGLGTDRGLGVLVFVGGIAATYFSIARPLLAGAHHEPNVSLSVKGVMASPVVVGIGLLYIVLGPRVTDVLTGTKPFPPMVSIVLALFCAADSDGGAQKQYSKLQDMANAKHGRRLGGAALLGFGLISTQTASHPLQARGAHNLLPQGRDNLPHVERALLQR